MLWQCIYYVGLVSGAAMSLCGHTGDRRQWGEGRHFARDIDRKLKKCAAVTPTGISGMAWVDIQMSTQFGSGGLCLESTLMEPSTHLKDLP